MQNDAIAATEQKDAELFRNFLILRVTYNLQEDEDPQDFEALDSETGAIPQAINWQAKKWWLDPDDTTSAHDGISVIVTADDYRYKTSELDLRIRSVLDKDIADPPTSGVMVGDAYLVATGATGDWAGHTDDIAVYTARGWLFREPVIGDLIYVEDEDAYYRYTVDGEWKIGPGPRAFDDASIPQSALIWDGRVENQTTNTPPVTASVGEAYIIGPSPTDDWAGHALDLAICEVENTFTIYEPKTGQVVFDIDQNIPYRWTGSSWVSAAGGLIGYKSRYTQGTGNTQELALSGSTDYSTTVPPKQDGTQRGRYDNNTIQFTVKSADSKIRIKYRCLAQASADGARLHAAIFRDSIANAIIWDLTPTNHVTGDNDCLVNIEGVIDSPGVGTYTFAAAVMRTATAQEAATLEHRLLQVEEIIEG